MTTIKIKKGAGTPSGLTFGELAYDVTNKRLFIGITGGNALLANTDGGVASFNGLTGAVTGVTTGVANTFGPLQSFTSGISASGGVTFSGNFSGATGSFSRLLTASAGISAAGGVTLAGNLTGVTATFSGNLTTTGSITTLGNSNESGITAYNNDQVLIVGNNYQYTLKSLGGSTSGVIATFSQGQNIEVIVNYWESGYQNIIGKSHTFIINCWGGDYGVQAFDYTESIVGSAGGVGFALDTISNGFVQIMRITATTPALGKFYSAFQFKTSIRQSGSF